MASDTAAGQAAADAATSGAAGSRVTARTRSLRFDAGGLALNLVATLGRRHTVPLERLDGPERLRAWCAGVGLTVADDEITAELLAELRLLREAAYDVAVCDLHGTTPSLPSVALLNECAHHATAPPRLEIAPGGTGLPGAVTVERAALTGRQLRSLIARDLISLMADPDRRGALRECEAPVCWMLYLDTTRGARRRWCSMQRCGNIVKAARHRTRTAP